MACLLKKRLIHLQCDKETFPQSLAPNSREHIQVNSANEGHTWSHDFNGLRSNAEVCPLWAESFWLTRGLAASLRVLPYFLFTLFVIYVKFSRLSKNLKGKSTSSITWEWPKARPFDEAIIEILVTITESGLETRDWQRREDVNVPNRKSKPEKTNVRTPSYTDSSALRFTVFQPRGSWRRRQRAGLPPTAGPLHLLSLCPQRSLLLS